LLQPDDYITFFSLRGWAKFKSGVLTTEQVYIHGKTMVVDDRQCCESWMLESGLTQCQVWSSAVLQTSTSGVNAATETQNWLRSSETPT
jgi:hypothetical protein